jgi:hypothetical protein
MNLVEQSIPRRRTVLAMAITSTVLAACGGGGGGDPVAGPGDDGGAEVPPSSAVKTWQAQAQLLEQTDGQAGSVQVAINADGLGYAVWSQVDDAGRRAIFSSRYSNGQWDATPSRLTSSTQQTSAALAFDPQIVVHANGDATAIWRVNNDGAEFIQFNYAQSGVWLQPPGNIFQAGESINSLKLVSDGTGRAMAVWHEAGGTTGTGVTAIRFNRGG